MKSKLIQQINKKYEWKHKIISSKKELRKWLKIEKMNYPMLTQISMLFPITEHDLLWKYQRRLRITEYYLNTNKKIKYIISRVMLHKMQFKYGMKIRLNSCGCGLRIIHQGSIITNGDLGENCQLFPNVLVGASGRDEKVPIIGNKCVICTGAVIVGNVKIGNSCVIGANSVVTKIDEQDNITIAGVPAKIINNVGSENWNSPNETWKLGRSIL